MDHDAGSDDTHGQEKKAAHDLAAHDLAAHDLAAHDLAAHDLAAHDPSMTRRAGRLAGDGAAR